MPLNQNDIDIIANALQSLVFNPMDERTLANAKDIVTYMGYSEDQVTVGFDLGTKGIVLNVPGYEGSISVEEALKRR